MNRDLNKRRLNSAFGIVAAAGAGGFTTSVPTPTVEVPKQVVLGFADIAMCLYIWKEYFGDEMSEATPMNALQEAGIVTSIAVAGGYLIAKAASGLLHEVLNLLSFPGAVASGLIASSGTATLGCAWMAACDHRYRKHLRAHPA